MAKNCVAEFDGGHFIFGNGDIYVNNGQRIESILPHKLRDYIFDFVDASNYDRSFVVADYGRTEMWACFPSAESTSNQCNKAVVWNWVNKSFSIRDIPDLAHIGYGSVDDPNSFTTWDVATPTWGGSLGWWSQTWASQENVLVMASPSDTKIYRSNSGNKEDTTNMTSFIERTGMTFDQQSHPNAGTVKRIRAIWT